MKKLIQAKDIKPGQYLFGQGDAYASGWSRVLTVLHDKAAFGTYTVEIDCVDHWHLLSAWDYIYIID